MKRLIALLLVAAAISLIPQRVAASTILYSTDPNPGATPGDGWYVETGQFDGLAIYFQLSGPSIIESIEAFVSVLASSFDGSTLYNSTTYRVALYDGDSNGVGIELGRSGSVSVSPTSDADWLGGALITPYLAATGGDFWAAFEVLEGGVFAPAGELPGLYASRFSGGEYLIDPPETSFNDNWAARIQGEVLTVPEPASTAVFLSLGLFGIAALRGRRHV